jgi:hypothetical protein
MRALMRIDPEDDHAAALSFHHAATGKKQDRGRYANFQTRQTAAMTLAGSATPEKPTQRRQAVHEPGRHHHWTPERLTPQSRRSVRIAVHRYRCSATLSSLTASPTRSASSRDQAGTRCQGSTETVSTISRDTVKHQPNLNRHGSAENAHKRSAPPGTRTPNPQIKSLLLCQLS